MEPEPLPRPDPAPSLADRLGSAWRADAPGRAGAWRAGVLMAVLLPLGPLLTLGAAEWLGVREQAAIRTLADSPAARRADARSAEAQALSRLGPASVADTVERFARVLPNDARLVSLGIAHDEDGEARLQAEVASGDPDHLRAALARDPVTAMLRSTGERRGDGVIIMTLEPGS